MANVISVVVAALACLTRRRVPPATLVEESTLAIVPQFVRFGVSLVGDDVVLCSIDANDTSIATV